MVSDGCHVGLRVFNVIFMALAITIASLLFLGHYRGESHGAPLMKYNVAYAPLPKEHGGPVAPIDGMTIARLPFGVYVDFDDAATSMWKASGIPAGYNKFGACDGNNEFEKQEIFDGWPTTNAERTTKTGDECGAFEESHCVFVLGCMVDSGDCVPQPATKCSTMPRVKADSNGDPAAPTTGKCGSTNDELSYRCIPGVLEEGEDFTCVEDIRQTKSVRVCAEREQSYTATVVLLIMWLSVALLVAIADKMQRSGENRTSLGPKFVEFTNIVILLHHVAFVIAAFAYFVYMEEDSADSDLFDILRASHPHRNINGEPYDIHIESNRGDGYYYAAFLPIVALLSGLMTFGRFRRAMGTGSDEPHPLYAQMATAF